MDEPRKFLLPQGGLDMTIIAACAKCQPGNLHPGIAQRDHIGRRAPSSVQGDRPDGGNGSGGN
jgi:hypothetical protein